MRDGGSASLVDRFTSGTVNPYVPRIILRHLAADPGVRAWTVDGTVAFVDISGFTKLSERLAKAGREGAEQITEAIGGSFEAILSVAYMNGGGLIKFGGDALLLLFEGDGHLERAARATVLMRRILRDVGKIEVPGAKVNLRMSQGLHTGRFHFFLVGEVHRELLPIGPAWSRTVAMEHDADAGEILISPEAAALLPARCLGATKGQGVLLKREPSVADEQPLADEALVVSPELVAECLPTAVRSHVAAGGGTPEHRPVTIAFVHFEETDKLIEHEGATIATERLDRLVSIVQTAAEEQDVAFLASDVDADGGKLILTAGAPRITGDDEERMLLTLRKIVDADLPIPVRIGVNRGSVFAGDIGPWYRRTYTVMGDAVNLSARLMAKAEPGLIYATADVLDRSNTLFETTELEPFAVKGKARPVRAWAVGPATGSRTRQVASRRLPLAGRAEEMAVLRDALGVTIAGEGRLVDIIGEPGIGKSRLLEELREAALDLRVLRATCEAYTANTPYIVWRELLRELLHIGWQDTDDAVGERLRLELVERAPDLLPWLPLIARAFDADLPPTPEMALLAEDGQREKLHESILRFLDVELAGPTAMEIEDAHHMDDASADLLTYLAMRLEGRPWLLTVSRRPTVTGFDPPDVPGLRLLGLAPLEMADAMAMAKMATEDRPQADHVLQLVVERSGGNPQFLHDLVDAVAESGVGGGLPDSVEAAAMARVDALAPEDRALVRKAAVFGVMFDPRMLAWVLDDERVPGPETWARLADYFEEEADGYLRFRRALIRDAAYEGLPYKLRRQLHGEIGRRLEADLAHPEEAAGLLSLHFIVAGQYAQAWHYAPIAAERARELYANVEAARLLLRAIEAGKRVHEVTDGQLGALHEQVGDAWDRAGEFQRSVDSFALARRLLRGNPLDESRLLLKRSKAEEKLGHYPQALAWVTRARRLLDGISGDEARRRSAQLSAWYATVLQAEGRTTDALPWCERAVAEAQAAGDQEALAQAYNVLEWVDIMMGRSDGRHLRKALAIYESMGDLAGQAKILTNLGAGAYFSGQWDEAIECWERGREAYLTVGQPVDAASSDSNMGEVLSDQGRLDEAEPLLREALRVWRASGDRYSYAGTLSQLGRVLSRSGRHEEALELFAEARDGLESVGAQADVLETDAKVAECYLFMGRHDDALELATSTLEKVNAPDSVSVAGPLLERVIGYARLQSGDVTGARAAFETCLAVARERGADFEVAMALRGLTQLDHCEGCASSPEMIDEAREIFERLRVIAAPAIPVPALVGA
jgi:class 3 adenylate cyclase/tetratricopeptide (TPR) repeat protein